MIAQNEKIIIDLKIYKKLITKYRKYENRIGIKRNDIKSN